MNKRRQSGEALIGGLLIGLAVGLVYSYFHASQTAQEVANATGSDQEVIEHYDFIKLVVPAAAGAGIGWILDEVSSEDDKGRRTSINVSDNDGSVNINVGDQDNDSSIDTETTNENSNNL